MRRNYWVVVANVVVMAVLVGCRDSIVAPAAAPSAAPVAMSLAPAGRPSLSVDQSGPGHGSVDLTVGPSGGVFHVGKNIVAFPANSICDPATSSYGPDYWDAPCDVISKPLVIHAEVRLQDGRSWVDFTPALRFAPSDDPSRWVWMAMATPKTRGWAVQLADVRVLYSPFIGATPVNDAATDPTLRTYVDAKAGLALRRVKHFSGYVVNAGLVDTTLLY